MGYLYFKEMAFNLTPQQLKEAEKSIYSQGGQDGVLEAIFKQIGEGQKRYFEAGARDGIDCSNTANLRLNKGWTGLLYDIEPLAFFVLQANITPQSINNLMDDYTDMMSLDIDGNEFWVWEAVNTKPRVVLIEYNSKFKNNESYSIEYNPDHKWEGDDYYSASLLALKKLGEQKGYTLVCVVDRFDAVFVRNNLIDPDYIPPTIDEILPQPIIAFDKVSDKKWVQV